MTTAFWQSIQAAHSGREWRLTSMARGLWQIVSKPVCFRDGTHASTCSRPCHCGRTGTDESSISSRFHQRSPPPHRAAGVSVAGHTQGTGWDTRPLAKRPGVQADIQSAPVAQAGVLYYSEEAVAFMRDLSSAFAQPPRHLRAALRRSCDFWNRRAALAPRPRATLQEILNAIHLKVHTTDCGVQHHVAAAGDLGEVHIRPKDASCALPAPLFRHATAACPASLAGMSHAIVPPECASALLRHGGCSRRQLTRRPC